MEESRLNLTSNIKPELCPSEPLYKQAEEFGETRLRWRFVWDAKWTQHSKRGSINHSNNYAVHGRDVFTSDNIQRLLLRSMSCHRMSLICFLVTPWYPLETNSILHYRVLYDGKRNYYWWRSCGFDTCSRHVPRRNETNLDPSSGINAPRKSSVSEKSRKRSFRGGKFATGEVKWIRYSPLQKCSCINHDIRHLMQSAVAIIITVPDIPLLRKVPIEYLEACPVNPERL